MCTLPHCSQTAFKTAVNIAVRAKEKESRCHNAYEHLLLAHVPTFCVQRELPGFQSVLSEDGIGMVWFSAQGVESSMLPLVGGHEIDRTRGKLNARTVEIVFVMLLLVTMIILIMTPI